VIGLPWPDLELWISWSAADSRFHQSLTLTPVRTNGSNKPGNVMYRIKEELISEILEEQIIGGGVSSVSTSVNTSADVYQNTSVSYSASSFSQVSGDLPQINVIGDPFAFSEAFLNSIV
jgi:hypothetical protein